MLIFTNRVVDAKKQDETAFGRAFNSSGLRLGCANVEEHPGGAGTIWKLTDVRSDLDDAGAAKALGLLFAGTKPVLVYIHGNNNAPAKCFERCALLGKLYGVEVIGFSWPSEGFGANGKSLEGVLEPDTDDEDDLKGVKARNKKQSGISGKIERFRQAKTNAENSAPALARFLQFVSTSAKDKKFTVAVHSLGCYFLQATLEIKGAPASLEAAQNVALLAACAKAEDHGKWLAKIDPKSQVFVTYNKGDSVLFAANIADGEGVKLGGELVNFPTISNAEKVRYICFTGGVVGAWGHRYFARKKMPGMTLNILKRILSSERDIQSGEHPNEIYPGSSSDTRICYMAGQAVPAG